MMGRARLMCFPKRDRDLYWAVYYNNIKSVKKLLRVPRVDPKIAIRLAAERGYTKFIKLLRTKILLPFGRGVWSIILQYCDAQSICQLQQTCTRLNKLAKAERPWARVLKLDYNLVAKEGHDSLSVYKDVYRDRICKICQAPLVPVFWMARMMCKECDYF